MANTAEKEAAKAAAQAEKEAAKAAKVSATVKWKGGVREYSQKIHGDDFAKLAKEFAGKVDGVVS